jgi:hypothetical protein
MRARRILIALSSLAVVAAALTVAPGASADLVKVESYQRAGVSEVCAAQPGETRWEEAWGADSTWHPTWEQWANGGAGGWTCTRSIRWSRDSLLRAYDVGDIGPGGGLVFLISGGLRYEMAPNTWTGDASFRTWCVTTPNDVPEASGTAVGTGFANTLAIARSATCGSETVAQVRRYGGTDGSVGQWFLPSADELNAMCNYSRYPTSPNAPDVSCLGDTPTRQDDTFAGGRYGFTDSLYWSSSQLDGSNALFQSLEDGSTGNDVKTGLMWVRPIRAF